MASKRLICTALAGFLLAATLAGPAPSATAATPVELELKTVTDLPPIAAGSHLVDLELSGDGGFVALVRTPIRWVIWRSADGETWEAQRLPARRFAETRLLAIAMVGSRTYVGGASATSTPRAWMHEPGSGWTRVPLVLGGGPGGIGFVEDVHVCGDRVVMWGSDSASNHYESAIWGFDGKGRSHVTRFPTAMQGGPNFAIFCRGHHFGAFIANALPPGADVDVENDVWVSATGAHWMLRRQDATDAPVFLSALDRAGNRLIATSHGEVVVASRGGLAWWSVTTFPAALTGSGRSFEMAGGDAGLFVLATHWLFTPATTAWWTPDARRWQQLDGLGPLEPGGIEAAVSSSALVIAPHAGFAEGQPVFYVAQV